MGFKTVPDKLFYFHLKRSLAQCQSWSLATSKFDLYNFPLCTTTPTYRFVFTTHWSLKTVFQVRYRSEENLQHLSSTEKELTMRKPPWKGLWKHRLLVNSIKLYTSHHNRRKWEILLHMNFTPYFSHNAICIFCSLESVKQLLTFFFLLSI